MLLNTFNPTGVVGYNERVDPGIQETRPMPALTERRREVKGFTKSMTVAVAVLGLAVAGCCCLAGDDESEPAPSQEMSSTADGASAETGTVAQARCPVMGGPINEDIYADHEGRRVYFCCEGCIATFKRDPEKYIALLKAEPED
jgi:YHS domain-containing protein